METLLVLPDAALADAAGTTVAAGPCTFAQSPVAGAAAGAGAAPTTAAAPSDASGYLAVACIGRMMLPLVPSCTTVLPASPAAFILALGDAASGAVTSYTLTVGAATSAAAVAEAVAILRHFTTMEAPPPGGVGGGTPPPRGHVLPAAAGGPPSAPPSASSSPGLAGRVERGSEVAARKILTLGETARYSIARRLAAATANAKEQQAPAAAAGGRSGGAGGRGRREAPVPKAVVWTFSGVGRASSGVAGALTGVGQRVATAVGGGLAGSAPMRRAREAPPNSVGGVFHTALSTGCLAFANIYEAADETGRALLTTTATGTTALTDARYGPRAASVAHDAGVTAVSAYRVVRFPSKFGATTVLKTFATSTADGRRAAAAGGAAGVAGGSGVAAAAATTPSDWAVGGLDGTPAAAAGVGQGAHSPAAAYAAHRGSPPYEM